MMIGKLAWPLWGGPKTTGVDWLILLGSLLPWAFLAAWLRRPTRRTQADARSAA